MSHRFDDIEFHIETLITRCFQNIYFKLESIDLLNREMSKRSIEELLEDVTDKTKKTKMYEHVKKHTLDSEEEDSDVDEDR